MHMLTGRLHQVIPRGCLMWEMSLMIPPRHTNYTALPILNAGHQHTQVSNQWVARPTPVT